MSDLEIIGRAIAIDFPSASQAPSDVRAGKKAVLTLTEASTVSGVPIHTLKAAIYADALVASRRGRCVVLRVELDVWLRENLQEELCDRHVGV